MAAIEDLAKKILDQRLRDEILVEVARLKSSKRFGLVFEEHTPELLLLPQMAAKLGTRVYKLGDSRGVPYRIAATVKGSKIKVVPEAGGPEETLDRSGIVVTKAFGDAIYPALIPVSTAERSPTRPWHVLINSDNYHALQLMLYGYEAKIDVIYIDPPYNTGARDWKYNNDYVDKNDGYRHSKWLSMMKKRLVLAKRLLKADGVLIVTIDENECHRLACLLQEIFPEARQEMVTIVNNAAGVTEGGFYRVEEYAFFCFFGKSRPCELADDFLMAETKTQKNAVWFSLTRYGGINSLPAKRPGLVYPVGVDPKTMRIMGTGRTLKQRVDAGELDPSVMQNLNAWVPDKTETVNGFPAVWPFRASGALSTWQLKPDSLGTASKDGFVRVRKQADGPMERVMM
jgi:adenine-specific DNA-methyltransferase